MVPLDESHISDAPILDAVLPLSEVLTHEWTMLSLIECHRVIRFLQIDDST